MPPRRTHCHQERRTRRTYRSHPCAFGHTPYVPFSSVRIWSVKPCSSQYFDAGFGISVSASGVAVTQPPKISTLKASIDPTESNLLFTLRLHRTIGSAPGTVTMQKQLHLTILSLRYGHNSAPPLRRTQWQKGSQDYDRTRWLTYCRSTLRPAMARRPSTSCLRPFDKLPSTSSGQAGQAGRGRASKPQAVAYCVFGVTSVSSSPSPYPLPSGERGSFHKNRNLRTRMNRDFRSLFADLPQAKIVWMDEYVHARRID